MEKIDNNSSDVSPLNRDEVINDSDFKDLMSRLENPENLCGTRYITTRYNSVKGIYEALVLGIAKTEEVSDFSKSKKGKVESAGGKYYEYYKNPDKRVGTKNKTSVLKNLNGKNSVSQFLEEHKEETGIRKDFVKRVKYLKSFSRPIEGEYSLDKRVNTKVTDVFVVEVPSYADVALNNPNSDDDHNGSLWIPLREMKEVIDSPSSKEVFDQLPKYYFPEVFDLIRGDISEKIHNKVLQLFEHLNKDSEIYKDLKRGLKKNNRSDKLKSFVDFGRIDSMKLTHLKDIFMTAFELKEENDKNLDKDGLQESLENKFTPHILNALEYEKNHRGVKYSSDFLDTLSKNKMESIEDVHNFVRGYSRDPNFKPEWKEWCLNIFKVSYCFKYAEKSFPYFDELDEYDKSFEKDVETIVAVTGLKMRNPSNKKEKYDIYLNYGEPKAKWRVIDKLMTKEGFDFRKAKDLLRRRIVFGSKDAMDKFGKRLSKNNSSKWQLECETAANGTQKVVGQYPIDRNKVPMEIQLLMEEEFQESETQEKHHDVYADLIKSSIRDDRLEEVSEDKITEIYTKCLENPEILAGENPNIVGAKIKERLRDSFIRIPSIKNNAKFAYYSKDNLLQTVGHHLRADEDDFFGSLMRYRAELYNKNIDSEFDGLEKKDKDLFDESFKEFFLKLIKLIPNKKKQTLEIYMRSNIRKSVD